MTKLKEIFQVEKPIIGMIHLAGNNKKEILNRALKELTIYQEKGVDGAIIEDYHGSSEDVQRVLKHSQKGFNIARGINILQNPYSAFKLANKFGAKFIQFDSVQTTNLILTGLDQYNTLKDKYADIAVLGGVGFKYIQPTGNPLETDLEEARQRCEAIVTTGEGTGIETPLNKLIQYKRLLNDFPLIVGAGVNLENIAAQLTLTDGAIIGSYFKPHSNTQLPVDKSKVKDLMDIVKMLRD